MKTDIFEKYYRLNDDSRRVDRLDDHSWRLRGKVYDIRVLSRIIEGSIDRNGELYNDHDDIQIELTMSCTPREAAAWMEIWMMEALAAGNDAIDKNLRAKFLAAYDKAQSFESDEMEYISSATAGDYGPGNPWDAPGMSVKDFI